MTKRLTAVVLLLLIIFGGTFGWDAVKSYFMKQYFAHFTVPPVSVSTAKVKTQHWQPRLSAVGSVVAINGVSVTSQVAGQVVALHFKSGEDVTKGQSLVQLDDGINRQALKNDMAKLKLDKLSYERMSRLFKQNAVSKSQLDQAQANLSQSQAAVATDQLNITYKNVKAPFSGRVGIRNVNIGEYVTAGAALVSLQQMNPIFVNFTLPEQNLKSLHKGQKVLVTVSAYPQEKFTGKITAINSLVDVDTRTISVQATLPNPKERLYPGAFATVVVELANKQKVLTIPQTAITYSLYGDTVFVVTPKPASTTKTHKNKAQKSKGPLLVANQRYIKVGERRGDEASVTSGVKAGETVVASGQIKLHNGSHVVVNNTVSFK